jgi:hypothetical protein
MKPFVLLVVVTADYCALTCRQALSTLPCLTQQSHSYLQKAHRLKLVKRTLYKLELCVTTSACMHIDSPTAKQQRFAAHLKLVHLRSALSRCNC